MPGFSEESAKRIAATVRAYEGSPVVPSPSPRGPYQSLPSKLALTTSVITARSGTTLGKGTIQLQTVTVDQSTHVATYAASPQDPIYAYNLGSGTIASGTLVAYSFYDGIALINLQAC